MARLHNKKAMGSFSLPTASMILKILNMCRQAHFKTCHHQNSDILFILVLMLTQNLSLFIKKDKFCTTTICTVSRQNSIKYRVNAFDFGIA